MNIKIRLVLKTKKILMHFSYFELIQKNIFKSFEFKKPPIKFAPLPKKSIQQPSVQFQMNPRIQIYFHTNNPEF